jgi:hypothetical protein
MILFLISYILLFIYFLGMILKCYYEFFNKESNEPAWFELVHEYQYHWIYLAEDYGKYHLALYYQE